MRPRDRRLKIIDIIRREGRVSVDYLVAEFSSSPETIRRDLKKLSRNGDIRKIHGGAMLPSTQGEGFFQQRMAENVAAKRAIAEKASELISPGDTLLIDTGSTTLIFTEEVARVKSLTVVTNSAEIAKVFGAANNDARIFLLGGEYHSDNRETLGSMVREQLLKFHATHAILTIGGLSANAGAVGYDVAEVALARAMLMCADRRIILADASKFNRTAPFVVAGLDKFDQLVCEAAPDATLEAALLANQVEIIC